MTTSYFIHCEACRENLDFEVDSWQIPLLLAIIKHACDIPLVAPLLDDAQGTLILGINLSRRLDPHWFERHRGERHPLVVIDEYGRINSRCGERYRCDRCDTSHYCNLTRAHDGEHAGRIRGLIGST